MAVSETLVNISHFLCNRDTQLQKTTGIFCCGFGNHQSSHLAQLQAKSLTTENINDQNSFVFWTFLKVKETT